MQKERISRLERKIKKLNKVECEQKSGNWVTAWSRRKDLLKELARQRTHAQLLPGIINQKGNFTATEAMIKPK